MMDAKREGLTVVSNRLPFSFERETEGVWQIKPSSGGLVSALLPVLRNRGGTWIGWTGTSAEDSTLAAALDSASERAGFTLQPVHLTADDVQNFYHGFANEIIWPLFHDMPSICKFDAAYWRAYLEVNRKFAGSILVARPAEFVWVHDYHLMNVAVELRAMGCRSRLGFFLHIPFPTPDLFIKLPWRAGLIEALLSFDVVGFQTSRDRDNFRQCVRMLVPTARIGADVRSVIATTARRETRIGVFPIGIDFDAFTREAAMPDVAIKAADLRSQLGDRKVMLGIDRLDYTKGIPSRLNAFRWLLVRYPQLREKLSLVQVVVPSRVGIAEYDELKTEIERLVGQINGEFMRPGAWVPVWYVYGNLTHAELLTYYRAADIALVTPLKDGMNLVAKEYCATRPGEDGVLVLSEFAGAAAQLRCGALLVNPYDVDAVADAILAAYEMDAAERHARMRRLQHSIRRQDVFWWVDSVLRAVFREDSESLLRSAQQAQRVRLRSDAVSNRL